jgi:hypothetical protein
VSFLTAHKGWTTWFYAGSDAKARQRAGGMEALLDILKSSIPPIGRDRNWIVALSWLLVFLIVALISLVYARRRSRTGCAHVVTPIDSGLDPVETERQALRAQHQVGPLSLLDDGFGLSKLQDGKYGFAMLPVSRDSPVLRTIQSGLFEIHKTADGAIQIVGFTSPAAAAAIRTERLRALLFAEPTPEASILVSIPLSRVLRYGSRDRNAVEVEVERAETERSASSKPPGTAAADDARKVQSA